METPRTAKVSKNKLILIGFVLLCLLALSSTVFLRNKPPIASCDGRYQFHSIQVRSGTNLAFYFHSNSKTEFSFKEWLKSLDWDDIKNSKSSLLINKPATLIGLEYSDLSIETKRHIFRASLVSNDSTKIPLLFGNFTGETYENRRFAYWFFPESNRIKFPKSPHLRVSLPSGEEVDIPFTLP